MLPARRPAGHQAAQNTLKTDYKDDCSLADAVPLVIRTLARSMDSSLVPEKVELATISRDASGKVVYKVYEAAEMAPLLEAANKEKEAAAAAAQ